MEEWDQKWTNTEANPKPIRTKSKSVAPCPASGACNIISWALRGLGSPTHQFSHLEYHPCSTVLQLLPRKASTAPSSWMISVMLPSSVARSMGRKPWTNISYYPPATPLQWFGSLSVRAASSALSCLDISSIKQISPLPLNLSPLQFSE